MHASPTSYVCGSTAAAARGLSNQFDPRLAVGYSRLSSTDSHNLARLSGAQNGKNVGHQRLQVGVLVALGHHDHNRDLEPADILLK